ncbi:hypothetical protein YERSI8AC_100030 [Enterobacterales bacterium 8AC]|nr:hypothetical protein YERSI8AC_100030 [Enterobacterales bacterium 8AC]
MWRSRKAEGRSMMGEHLAAAPKGRGPAWAESRSQHPSNLNYDGYKSNKWVIYKLEQYF